MSFPVFDARFIRSFLFFSVFLQCGLDLGFWRLDFGYWRPSFATGGERLRKNLAHRSLRSGEKKEEETNLPLLGLNPGCCGPCAGWKKNVQTQSGV